MKSRQLGRRSVVTFAAIAVRSDLAVYTPQQLAHRKVGVPFYFGTHYLALHMLEGFLTRDQIVVCSVPHGSRFRFDLLMKGEIEGTTLTEPYVSLAEKKGCRLVCSAFYHGTQVGTDQIDAETMSAYNRAVAEAVRRINADKRGYLHYFIDYHKARDPEIGTLTVDDMRESRLVVCEPAPIPLEEMQRTYEWVKSWGMLETTQTPLELVNMDRHAPTRWRDDKIFSSHSRAAPGLISGERAAKERLKNHFREEATTYEYQLSSPNGRRNNRMQAQVTRTWSACAGAEYGSNPNYFELRPPLASTAFPSTATSFVARSSSSPGPTPVPVCPLTYFFCCRQEHDARQLVSGRVRVGPSNCRPRTSVARAARASSAV